MHIVVLAMLCRWFAHRDSPLEYVLDGSGWTTALSEVAYSGTADSFLKVANLTWTRHADQVTVLTLQTLQQEAYMQSEGVESGGTVCAKRVSHSWSWDMKHWSIFLSGLTEKGTLIVHYVQVLEKLTPLFCIGPCELCMVESCSHQGYKIFALPYQGLAMSLGTFQDQQHNSLQFQSIRLTSRKVPT